MIIERVERRVLGAIEFTDALTGARVRQPLQVASDTMRLTLNPSWLYVIRGADALAAHGEAFLEPPASPPQQSLAFPLMVLDPNRQYLARRAQVRLPRGDLPASDPDSLLRPLKISLYPSMARPVDAAWACARVFVYTMISGARVGVANALLRLTPDLSGAATVRALSDANGEALLAVLGAPPVLPSGGATDSTPHVVYTRTFGATLTLILDEDVAQPADGDPPPVPDPDLIEERLAAANPLVHEINPPVLQLGAGITQRVEVEVTL